VLLGKTFIDWGCQMSYSGNPREEDVSDPEGIGHLDRTRLRKEIEQERRTMDIFVVLNDISPEGWNTLVREVQKFANGVAQEATRIEVGERDREAPCPEIISSTILRAVRRHQEIPETPAPPPPPPPSPIPKWLYAVRVSAPVLGVATGISGTYLHSSWQLVVFVTMSCAFVVATLVAVFGRA
jgi:hypothetical protein